MSYPVVVTVPSGGDTLPEGSRVQVALVISRVAAAVTVPASAVTPTGPTSATLQVFANGVASTRVVQTGVTGGGVVQILSGVAVGESVVVADMELPLPGISFNTGRPSQGGQAPVPPGVQPSTQPQTTR